MDEHIIIIGSMSDYQLIRGQRESLLGRLDSEALGIIQINPRGKSASEGEKVKAVTVVTKMPPIPAGLALSGGQTQEEIDQDMKKIAEKFQDLFEGIGQANVTPIHIEVEKGTRPVTQRQQPVPICLMEPLKKQLDQFVAEGVIVGPLGAEHATGWIHNVVICGKKWDKTKIRINLDTRQMNDAIQKNGYPIPTVEQLRHNLTGSDRFSTLDLNFAFHQFPISRETEELFKFTTPFGIYRYKRLVMGTPPASAECHSKMNEIIQGLPGIVQIKDDLIVHGRGREHDARLEKTLQRLQEYGLTLRREKCKLGQSEVIFFGHVFSKEGMSPDPEKVENIKKWPEPKDKSEVKSFLQTVQFVAPYMRVGAGETYSDVTKPLRQLTRFGKHFSWNEECRVSFLRLKSLLVADTVLVNYDPTRKTRLYVDHGPVGIASTIAQAYEVEGERKDQWRTVYHTGRALTKAEQNYGKIEGESLAVYSGIKTNSRYLYGTKFQTVTDHEPLVVLYNNPGRLAPVRVERHRSKLRQFDFTLTFEPGSTSPCDYGSRHPPPSRQYTPQEKEELGIEEEEEDGEIWVNRVVEDSIPEAVTLEEVQKAVSEDERLTQLAEDVQQGRLRKELQNTDFKSVFQELTWTKGVLLKGAQLVLPRSLQAAVIALAHEGHQGEDRTIRYLRERVWFPRLAEQVREYVKTCDPGCTASLPRIVPAPIVNRETPDKPWDVCAADYKGPIGGPRGYYFHVLVDTYSKWPEVAVTRNTRFERLFPVLDSSFSSHGIPSRIIHDNGPPYDSAAWREYAKKWGFQSKPCTPEHPQGNGLAEKMMASIVKMTHAALAEGKDPKVEVTKWLINYRNTPHPSTKKTPSELMMNRTVRTKVPALIVPSTAVNHQEAQLNDTKARQKQKVYADKHRRAKQQDVKVGDKVLLWQKKTTTKQPYDPDPYVVTKVIGTQITGERRGKHRRRNIERWRVVKPRPAHLIPERSRGSRQQTRVIIHGYSSDSESDFEIVQQGPVYQEERRGGEGTVQTAEQGGEEAVQEVDQNLDQGEEKRLRPVRKRRQPDRLGMEERQRTAQEHASPRQRKRKQAAAAKVATPRREQGREESRLQPPGSIRTASGWRRERWTTQEETD